MKSKQGLSEARSESSEERRSPYFTVYDLYSPLEQKRSIRELPRLLTSAMTIIWRAGRTEFLVSSALQLLTALGLIVLVLAGRDLLAGVLSADRAGGALSDVLPSAIILAAVTALLGFLSAVQREQQQLLGELTNRYTLDRILDVACAVELAAFEVPGFHNLLERARAIGSMGPLNFVFGLSALIGAVAGGVAAVVALLALEPVLVPLALLAFLPAWLVTSRRAEVFYRFVWRYTPHDRERQYLAILLTHRDPAKEVRAFGLADFLRRRHEHLYEERLAELRRIIRKQLLYSMLANVGIFAVVSGTLSLLALLMATDRIGLADAGAAAGAIVLLGQRLVSAGSASGALYESALFVEDYKAFLKLGLGVVAAPQRRRVPQVCSRIAAEDVTFTYPSGDKPALHSVSLHIDRGEVVALVGENGSGKTTLAKLLTGLYLPDRGRVLWGGVDIATVDRHQLRDSIAFVFQDFVRYSLAARDNIGLGRHERFADFDAIVAAARQSGIDAELRGLRAGYETVLGPEFEGGTDLSAGQWQRVALARAFFRNAPFIVLDEPMAALDARAEHDLFARIRELLAGRSVLLISHRFSGVRSADRIYVLRKGAILEHGTHGELMAHGGLYSELFTLQAGAYLDNAEAQSSPSRSNLSEGAKAPSSLDFADRLLPRRDFRGVDS